MDADDSSSASLNYVTPDDVVLAPIRALDENVGLHRGDNRVRCVFIEDHDHIDGRQRGQDLGSLRFAIDRAIGRLRERLHRSIAVDADNQQIAERPGVAKIADMTRMQDIEHTVGENHDAPDSLACRQLARFGARQDSVGLGLGA